MTPWPANPEETRIFHSSSVLIWESVLGDPKLVWESLCKGEERCDWLSFFFKSCEEYILEHEWFEKILQKVDGNTAVADGVAAL